MTGAPLVSSGNDCYIAIENGPVEIVDFPIKNGDFPISYVSLPEGTMFCPWHTCELHVNTCSPLERLGNKKVIETTSRSRKLGSCLLWQVGFKTGLYQSIPIMTKY